jgi:hypothetical protein
MSKRTIPAAMRRSLVAEARGRCAYCRTPTAISGARLVVDHIVPEALGGPTELENLCLACHCCNEFKGVQVSSQDPVSRRVVALFHPRRHRWSDHFRWSPDGSQVLGISRIGRATIVALNMNHPLIVEARRLWTAVGWHPPIDDL